MKAIMFSNVRSMASTITAKMTEATITTIVELWSCGNVGVVRFFYVIEHTSVFYSLAGAERFELPSTVLETAILPLNYAPKKEAVR